MIGRCLFCGVFVVLLALAGEGRTVHRSFVNGYPAEAAQQPRDESGGNACEKMVAALLPPEKVNELVGFFAPVVKKYRPTFDRFTSDYAANADKLATVAKYLPAADRAYREAQAMKVPERFEKQKADYLRFLKALLFSLRLATRAAKSSG